MVCSIGEKRIYPWRAVDDEGEVLYLVGQRRRDTEAALKLLRRLLHNQPVEPQAITTEGRASYGAAVDHLDLRHLRRSGRLRENDRIENSQDGEGAFRLGAVNLSAPDKGLLTLREHHSDGRTHSIMLTAEAETRVPRLAAIADQRDADFFSTLSKDDRQAMERGLRGRVEQRCLRPMAGLL